jgi:hypothetical protein
MKLRPSLMDDAIPFSAGLLTHQTIGGPRAESKTWAGKDLHGGVEKVYSVF